MTMIISGVAAWCLLDWIFPDACFRWYPLIPTYFTVMGFLIAIGMIWYSRSKPAKGMMIYMLLRIIKMTVTALAVFLYYKLVGESVNAMLITAAVFYLLFLLVEAVIFHRLGNASHR